MTPPPSGGGVIRWAATLAFAAWLGFWAPGPACAAVTLTVTPQQGVRDIDFGDARSLPEPETVTRQVRVKVTSTTSNVYKLFMRVNGPLANLAGKEFHIEEDVQFFVSEASAGATVRHPNPTPMGPEQELILSNQSEDLLVTFIVRVPAGQEAGGYRTTLSFRVES